MSNTLKILSGAGLPIAATAGTIESSLPSIAGAPGSALIMWLVGAWACLGIADKVLRFWKDHLKEKPDPRSSYEPKGSVDGLREEELGRHREVMDAINNLRNEFNNSISEIREEIDKDHRDTTDALKGLRGEFNERQQAATLARRGIHKDIEGVKVDIAGLAATVSSIQQQQSIKELRHGSSGH